MRYAVISDIHSNIEALTAVLERIDAIGVDKTVCLGDIVGYNAAPNECIDLVRKLGLSCVMGNHDARASGLEELHDFNAAAAEAIYWTRKQLTEENRLFLRKLPRRTVVDDAFLPVHGWINDTDSYILSATDASINFRLMEREKTPHLTFFGHTHVRIAYLARNGCVETSLDETITLKEGVMCLANPGGVGQPRDRDPRAAFLVFDAATQEISFFRTEYNIDSCRRKILGAGLPEVLAERLLYGW